MAVAEINLSRRALLGAAFAVPFVRHPGPDPGSISFFPLPVPGASWTLDRARGDERAERRAGKWQTALAHSRNAEAAVAAAQGADDDVFDRVLGRFNHALRRLLRAPAPDPAAFAAKLALAIDQEIWELTGGEACLAALVRDAKRLGK